MFLLVLVYKSLNFMNLILLTILSAIVPNFSLQWSLDVFGEIDLNIEDEVFFNTSIAGVQPRSSIGYTKDQHLVLMVVDGRQAESRGVYLEELAIMMSEFNCLEAINLDGGGSSAMVADSRLLNRPVGRTSQREVMSAIGIFYK